MLFEIRFYVTTPTSLMIQPGLCAHTVITLSEGPAIVAGFEAKLVEDDLRQDKCSIIIPLVCAKRQNSWPSKRVPTLLYLIIYVILGGVRQNLGNMWSVSKWTEKIFGGARKVENHGIKEEQIISRECKRRLHACKNLKKLRECSWVLCLYWSLRNAVFHPIFVSINCMLQCVITGWEQAAMSEKKKKR